jgi:ATP diphosphatase
MADEESRFAFGDVVEAITTKLIRRHPHVFGNGDAADADAVKRNWDAIKAAEKAARPAERRSASAGPATSILDDVPVGLPGLTRAVKLQKRAGRVGFDWNDPHAVIAKVREELSEIEHELASAEHDPGRVEDELGDLLFAVANLARHVSVDPEKSLRRANAKFFRRFAHIEHELARDGKELGKSSLDEMEALWAEAKEQEHKA